ncbi:AI-2E family transporter [uncultured Tateyamaria sp.]|uniref:AI-2E family transporter n=1 Tax=uncultured Tateyamaria sp. TaxID=455651 RepID=UPI002603457C|nr:AI-2E family transporter [uncultured Tateyamaria sp.]
MKDDVRALRHSAAILATLATFVVVYFARDLMLPVLLGFLISLTLSPVNRAMQRFGLPAALSATLLISGAAAAFAAVFYFAGETLASGTNDAPAIMRELRDKLSGVASTIEKVKDASSEVEAMTSDTAGTSQPVVVEQPGLMSFAVSAAAGTITSAIVALTLALFLLASGDMFYIKIVRAFKTMTGKKRALTTVYDIERRVSHYLLTITVINACLGVVVGFAMWLIGLEYAYIWGIAAFLLNYLPILGGLIGSVLIGAYAIISFDSLSYALLAPLVYQTLSSSEAQFVTPYLVGKRLKLNTVAVFLTVVLWGWLWGIAGALVAVPFLLVFKVICDNVENLHTIGTFLSGADHETPDEQEAL